jgi:large subunit ribosomal protein L5
MAETTEKEQEKAPKAPKAPRTEKKTAKGAKGGTGFPTDPAPKPVEGTPRLKRYYDTTIRPNLQKQFGLTNPHQVPRLVKIVMNVGMGEGSKTPKLIETVAEELALITGQKATVRRSKKSIANFNLREGMPVGVAVTLRNARMYEFLDRFINLVVPRIRDFRGLPNKSFDGRGNYTIGMKEQMIFPEIDFDKVEKIHGMDITFVTTAGRDDLAMALLREFGWPFRGETPLAVA